MKINDTYFTTDLIDILIELRNQLEINGIPLLQNIKNTPDNVMVSCPYHKDGQERKPSAGIRKDDGTFHCFACGEVHTLPEMISFCFGHYDDMIGSFGWNWLCKNFLTVSVEERKDVKLDFGRDRNNSYHNSRSSGPDNNLSYVSEEELDSYRYIHPYMYKRRLTDEVIDLFDIGYDKDSKCITFPVRDIGGNTLFIARRSVDTKFFNYPQGVEKPLYGLYEYYKYKDFDVETYCGRTDFRQWVNEVIVCESMLDALSFWVVGKFAVALNGTGSDLQIKQLNELPCRTIILCTDMDDAGMQARKKLKSRIKNKIVMQYFLPEGRKDANDCDPEELKRLVPKF